MSDSKRTPRELRVPFDVMRAKLQEILLSRVLAPHRAARCAFLVAENSLVGVSSHGVHRFPRLIEWIDRGFVNVAARPARVSSFGAAERWDGKLGVGPLNAERCMRRAMTLAARHGVGSVALSNTNHWLRAGTYGWQAANRGYAALCFTNTEPNLPPWGGTEPRLGNNPIVLAVPRADGRHVVYDRDGNPTSNPAEILESHRALPIGYWKGAGLSVLIDLLVAGLSGGRTTADLGRLEAEYGVSQLFVAFAPALLGPSARDAVERTLRNLLHGGGASLDDLRYPGERIERMRTENLRLGVPVDEAVWEAILALL
jgi:3-dehydro-L-gulonate 2-dehydrogenase